MSWGGSQWGHLLNLFFPFQQQKGLITGSQILSDSCSSFWRFHPKVGKRKKPPPFLISWTSWAQGVWGRERERKDHCSTDYLWKYQKVACVGSNKAWKAFMWVIPWVWAAWNILISKLTTPVQCKGTIEKFSVSLGCGIQQLMGQKAAAFLSLLAALSSKQTWNTLQSN